MTKRGSVKSSIFESYTYGFRGHLSDVEKRERAATTERCRHSCHGVFLYYCDNRAKVRKTPGNILIRNCSFKNPDAILAIPFGHKWCCNRSLDNITFDNCTFDGIRNPMKLECPREEPLSLFMKNCTVIGREGYEDIEFIVGKNVATVDLECISFKNLRSPNIVCDSNTTINVKN